MNNEPVAWMIKTLDGKRLMLYGKEQPPKFESEVQYIPLYTHSASKAKDRFSNYESICLQCGTTIYKPAKTLTDEEIEALKKEKWLNEIDAKQQALKNIIDWLTMEHDTLACTSYPIRKAQEK
jgi:hypothetical protein